MGKTPKKTPLKAPAKAGTAVNKVKRNFNEINFVSKRRPKKVTLSSKKKSLIKKYVTKEQLLERHRRKGSLLSSLLADKYNFEIIDEQHDVRKYFGDLILKVTRKLYKPEKMFCAKCFEINVRYDFSKQTSPTNLKLHLMRKHNLKFKLKSGVSLVKDGVLKKTDPKYHQKLSLAITKLCVLANLPFDLSSRDEFSNFCR